MPIFKTRTTFAAGISLNLTQVDEDYNISIDDCVLEIQASGLDISLSLPSAVGRAGKLYIFKRIDNSVQNVIIIADASDTIDGDSTYEILDQYDSVQIISDGTNWIITERMFIGSSGFSGYSGAAGSEGLSGFSGYSGRSGYSGYSSASGFSGYSSISGFSGYLGLSGFSGYVGLSGFSGYSSTSGFSGYSSTSGFSGYSGLSGFSGYSGLSAFSGYSSTSGFSGYSSTSGFSGYSSISGFSGYSGPSGFSGYSAFSGYSGSSGFSGYIGPSGFSGYSSISGFSGYSGPSGFSGYSGPSGFSGYSGISGFSGYSGKSGFSGYSGLSGFSGYSGISGFSGYSGALSLTAAPGSDTTASGLIISLTAGENLVFGDAVYLKSDGLVWKADADGSATYPCMGMAIATISSSNPGNILLHGIARNDAWSWTVGGIIYLSTTAGSLTQTQPSATDNVIQVLGIATHADRMYFFPDLTYITHT